MAGITQPKLGDRLGPYLLRSDLGASGMGIVYLAEHGARGEQVALKLLQPELVGKKDAVAAFFAEPQALRSIGHENVLQVKDVVEEGPHRFFVTELLRGRPLSEIFKRGPISLPRALHIARQVADALDTAHAVRVIHRNLKPANVFLLNRGSSRDLVKVLEFGVHKDKDAKGKSVSGLVGTPAYMAPEQLKQDLRCDHRVDVYAFGVLLFELCVGRRPFNATDVNETVKQQLMEPPPVPSAVAPSFVEIPDALDRLILACLEKDPEKRATSTQEIILALAAIAEIVGPYESIDDDEGVEEDYFVTRATLQMPNPAGRGKPQPAPAKPAADDDDDGNEFEDEKTREALPSGELVAQARGGNRSTVVKNIDGKRDPTQIEDPTGADPPTAATQTVAPIGGEAEQPADAPDITGQWAPEPEDVFGNSRTSGTFGTSETFGTSGISGSTAPNASALPGGAEHGPSAVSPAAVVEAGGIPKPFLIAAGVGILAAALLAVVLTVVMMGDDPVVVGTTTQPGGAQPVGAQSNGKSTGTGQPDGTEPGPGGQPSDPPSGSTGTADVTSKPKPGQGQPKRPEAKPDATTTPPAAKPVETRPDFEVRFTSEPPGATVLLGNKGKEEQAGVTPFSKTFRGDQRETRIVVKLDGYRETTKTVPLSPNGVVEVKMREKKAASTGNANKDGELINPF